ncbi:Amidohydrolase family protein [Amycolatopsis rubida]|uniref:Amidohydrolase family protein n=1 Tax=Amycolatopsis rubida TaxID=112413 RepID=A0A1I5E438_9PSEU|nr:amidohydrolase family protein [Amycolatopsis rubida]SFO06157.1 Amidohydrolase family protein [Amycolatopsis rubida]
MCGHLALARPLSRSRISRLLRYVSRACSVWPNRLGLALADHVAQRFAWMVQHGITLIPGTDASTPNSNFDNYARALHLYEHLGCDRASVIEMATMASARALGLDRTMGRLSTGYVADGLVVNGDPLADLAALSRVCIVLAQGRAAEIRRPSP